VLKSASAAAEPDSIRLADGFINQFERQATLPKVLA
jgi:hypothetical protein